eukprot:CAMPEP_0202351886 /NCGR_PEP_ID=MMETSP1126-20121109/8324_1 /ASSEMBLY_ACC=CAM_ASM_000457 /TAXON_ID=3047 /ORGANISM="Dunaliella tertiolecta, Strain CCMP1320" /LENGTH=101 /DNA_ID=CAMNT_0048944037 /DNA_START=661 /DNA_END=966 /DNA_ORIENTATION=+
MPPAAGPPAHTSPAAPRPLSFTCSSIFATNVCCLGSHTRKQPSWPPLTKQPSAAGSPASHHSRAVTCPSWAFFFNRQASVPDAESHKMTFPDRSPEAMRPP